MKYMVMETNASHCVVLDEAGRFLITANGNYSVGQTFDAISVIVQPKKANSVVMRMITIAGSVAACLALVFAIFAYMNINRASTHYASVYMTINPEVRIDVSEAGRVVGLSPGDGDGIILLGGYEGVGRELGEVAIELAGRAIDMGFLSDGGKVSFSIDSPDEAWFWETGGALHRSLGEHLLRRVSVTVEIDRFANSQDIDIQNTMPDASHPDRQQPEKSDVPSLLADLNNAAEIPQQPPAPEPPLHTPPPADTEPSQPPDASPPAAPTEPPDAASPAAPTEPPDAAPPAAPPDAPSPAVTSPAPLPAPLPAPSPPSEPEFISREEALEIALNHAGVSRSDIRSIEIDLEWSNRRRVYYYDVEFRSGRLEFEYDIDAITGIILSFEWDD